MWFLLLLNIAACTPTSPATGRTGTDSADTGDTADCSAAPEVTWEGWAQGFFRTYCASCHSASAPDRHGAPEDLNFDTLAEVQAQAAAIRGSVLEQGSMPVGGGVTEEARTLLEVFLRCGLEAR